MQNVNYITCKVHENGLEVLKGENMPCRITFTDKLSTRGKISGFSSRSANRLRRLLLDIDFKQSWAICLTLPKIKDVESVDYSSLWHGFCVDFSRKHKNAFVWRVELQMRKVPHWHCVFAVIINVLCLSSICGMIIFQSGLSVRCRSSFILLRFSKYIPVRLL